MPRKWGADVARRHARRVHSHQVEAAAAGFDRGVKRRLQSEAGESRSLHALFDVPSVTGIPRPAPAPESQEER